MTTVCYRSLVNIKSWPREFTPSQNIVIVGIRGGHARSCVNESHQQHRWRYLLDIPDDEQGKKFTKAINNIMFAHWLLSSGHNPCDTDTWNNEQFFKKFSTETHQSPNHQLTVYHSDLVENRPHFIGEVVLPYPEITFNGLFSLKDGLYPRFELVKGDPD